MGWLLFWWILFAFVAVPFLGWWSQRRRQRRQDEEDRITFRDWPQ